MNSQTFSQKVGDWLFQQSGCSLLDFCERFGYYPTAIKIMNLDEHNERASKAIIARDNDLRELYISYSKDSKSIARKGEHRSWTQYFKDLICGWVCEDLFMEMLKEQGIEIHKNGCDSKRNILINDVNQDADFEIKIGDVSRRVELTNEFNDFLKSYGYIEKRAPALRNLWKNKSIWIYRDILESKYVLVDFATEKVNLILRYHSVWGKDVHRFDLKANNKFARDDRLLIPEIISVIGCSIADKQQPPLNESIDPQSPPHTFSGQEEAKPVESIKQVKNTSKSPTSNKNLDDKSKDTITKTEPQDFQSGGEEVIDEFQDVDFV